MATDTRDGKWEVDLIWKYLRETEGPGVRTGGWYRYMDPKDTLNDRASVYDMLVKEESQTNPEGQKQWEASMIPWNQRNTGFRKAFNNSKYACGSAVKLAFQKYMGWPLDKGEPQGPAVSNRAYAIDWIVRNLKAGHPVRAHMAKKRHYVGIVGF